MERVFDEFSNPICRFLEIILHGVEAVDNALDNIVSPVLGIIPQIHKNVSDFATDIIYTIVKPLYIVVSPNEARHQSSDTSNSGNPRIA